MSIRIIGSFSKMGFQANRTVALFSVWLGMIGFMLILLPSVAHGKTSSPPVVVCCADKNDLYSVLSDNGFNLPRFDTPAEAIANAPKGGGVLILADGYPATTTQISSDMLTEAKQKGLRLYVEFPESIGPDTFGKPRKERRARAVISSDFFGSELRPMRIIVIHDCHQVGGFSPKSHIVSAIVAGSDRAVFGLPEKTHPLLYEYDANTLVATSKFSQFVTARYAPQKSWQVIWRKILAWVSRDKLSPTLAWEPLVRPTYAKNESLPKDFERRALERALDWVYKSHLLVTAENDESFRTRKKQEKCYRLPDGGLPEDGDGRLGMAEGFTTDVDYDGNQRFRVIRRVDNHAETAMALALGWKVLGRDKDRQTAANLLDYIYFLSDFQQGPMADPKHPAFGLTAWGLPKEKPTTGSTRVNYLASDCRQVTAGLAATTMLGTGKWDERHLRYMLAVERVTAANGFGHRMTTRALEVTGWLPFSSKIERPHVSDSPPAHFLLAYHATGHKPFLEKAKRNFETVMSTYPKGIKWWNTTNSAQSTYCTALAWLVRTEDTPRHRQWLYRVAKDLLHTQEACGAIRDYVGRPGHAQVTGYGPCKSNAEYGLREAVLLQENGDPITDMLYCNGFALVAMHEAYAATGDPLFKEAEDKLAKFVCRIQIESEKYPYLDGAWFRAFDIDKWEFWGSAADIGWGGWSVETGWGGSWTTVGLALRQLDTTLWDVCAKSNIKEQLPTVYKQMAQNEGLPWSPGDNKQHLKVSHAAVDKPVTLLTKTHPHYTHEGGKLLTDGKLGIKESLDIRWLGVVKDDLVATVDMGKPTPIRHVGVNCLQNIRAAVHLPELVEIAVSDDGKEFQTIETIAHAVPRNRGGAITHTFTKDDFYVTARYLRVRAKNAGVIPKGVKAAGGDCFIFVDEIIVNPNK